MTAVQPDAATSSTKPLPKLRIAFIGAGGIADAHARSLRKMADVEIVAMSDISERSLQAKAEAYDLRPNQLFTDYEKMLAKVQPDAVTICTPNGLHAPASIAASKAGAHVIVEKPMAMSAAEAKAMIDAANAADRKLVVGFQYRYDARTQFLKAAIDEGQFGKIHFGRVQALRRRGIPNWGVFGRKDLQGGGPMIDIGVHMLEQTHYLMGSPRPVAAVGMTATYLGDKPSDRINSQWKGWDYKTYTVEDLAAGHIRFENGAVIHIEASFAAHIGDGVMDLQLMGEKAGCTWADTSIFRDEAGHMVNIKPGWLPKEDFSNLFDAKLRNFVDHVLYNKPTMAPAEHGLMVQQMLDGIYRSAENGGKEVAIASA